MMILYYSRGGGLAFLFLVDAVLITTKIPFGSFDNKIIQRFAYVLLEEEGHRVCAVGSPVNAPCGNAVEVLAHKMHAGGVADGRRGRGGWGGFVKGR
jgi:hypothetical protein